MQRELSAVSLRPSSHVDCALTNLLHLAGGKYTNNTSSQSSVPSPISENYSLTASSSSTICIWTASTVFRTLSFTHTAIVSASTITTVGVFYSIDELASYGRDHSFTLIGPTTFVTTIAEPFGPNAYLGDGCCGHCSIYFPSVDVHYWPVAAAKTSCLESIATVTVQTSLTSTRNAARAHDLLANSSFHGVTRLVQMGSHTSLQVCMWHLVTLLRATCVE